MLKLDIIKRHILPKTHSQRYEIKILNSKKFDEQLNLTRSNTKNKVFEEFRAFKFQQNLQTEFTKNDEGFKNKIFADPWFDSAKIEFSNINTDELLDTQHNELSSEVERWMYDGSGWTIN